MIALLERTYSSKLKANCETWDERVDVRHARLTTRKRTVIRFEIKMAAKYMMPELEDFQR